jgi:hypothetical protein
MKERHCPHCAADLYGEVIPGHADENGNEQRYRRALGIEIPGVYDGTLFYACPDCHETWHRWTSLYAPRLWEAAERYRRRFTAVMKGDPPCSE